MSDQEHEKMNKFRQELLDKMEVYRVAGYGSPAHKAVVQRQCLDFLSDLYRAVLVASPEPSVPVSKLRELIAPWLRDGDAKEVYCANEIIALCDAAEKEQK